MRTWLSNIKIKGIITVILLILIGVAIFVTYKSFGIMNSRKNLETPEQKVMVELETSENSEDGVSDEQDETIDNNDNSKVE